MNYREMLEYSIKKPFKVLEGDPEALLKDIEEKRYVEIIGYKMIDEARVAIFVAHDFLAESAGEMHVFRMDLVQEEAMKLFKVECFSDLIGKHFSLALVD